MQFDSTSAGAEKTCTTCKVAQPVGQFFKKKARADGLSSQCKGCCAAYRKNIDAPAKARHRVAQKAWKEANRERVRATDQKSHKKNIDRKREQNRLARKRNLELDPIRTRLAWRIAEANSRARKFGATGTVSVEQAETLLIRAGGRCQYCGVSAPLTLDHMQPLKHKGKHTASNLVPCCLVCNSSKANKPVDEWLYDAHGTEGLGRVLLFLDKRKRANQI